MTTEAKAAPVDDARAKRGLEVQLGLRMFHGSEVVYKNRSSRVYYTDGVQYLAINAGAYWLIDAIGSYQRDRRILDNEMLAEIQFWKLTVNPADMSCVLECFEDSCRPPVIRQEIEYTDFPLDEITIYVGHFNGGPIPLLMLPSEY